MSTDCYTAAILGECSSPACQGSDACVALETTLEDLASSREESCGIGTKWQNSKCLRDCPILTVGATCEAGMRMGDLGYCVQDADCAQCDGAAHCATTCAAKGTGPTTTAADLHNVASDGKQPCCTDATLDCLACAAGSTADEYCAANPNSTHCSTEEGEEDEPDIGLCVSNPDGSQTCDGVTSTSSTAVKASYECVPGQGESGKSLGDGADVFTAAECGAACESHDGCVAFDFTGDKTASPGCRFYPAGSLPRTDAGADSRQYCQLPAASTAHRPAVQPAAAPATRHQPTCKRSGGRFDVYCGDVVVKAQAWGIGPEGAARAEGNCNHAHRTTGTRYTLQCPAAIVPGYTDKHIVNVARDKASSLSDCMKKAKRRGFAAAGFRNANHASLRDTCFYYTAADTAFQGNTGDKVHTSACADADKAWPDCKGTALPGYSNKHLVNARDKASSLAECREKAKVRGFAAAGFRNKNHSDARYQDTCFYYTAADPAFQGNTGDMAHTSACTDADEAWPDCKGTALPGWSNKHIIHARDKAFSLAECREKAKAKGYAAVGFRNKNHSDARYQDTCFYYTAADPAFQGNTGDMAHTSACTDAGKAWPNCN